MNKLFIFLFFSYITFAKSDGLIYKWINLKKIPFQGDCYQVDLATQGKKFSHKVKKDLCKSHDIQFIFNPQNGKCYETNLTSDLTDFSKITKITNCAPKKIAYKLETFLNKYGCYQVDLETQGKLFFYQRPEKDCSTLEKNVYWKLENEFQGYCYTKTESGHFKKISKKSCKPNNLKYTFKKTTPTDGVCYELDPKGKEYYINRTNLKNCKLAPTEFVFLKSDNALEGQCYEIDSATKGNQYTAKVNIDNCL